VSKQVFIAVLHTVFRKVIFVSLHCSKSGFSLVVCGSITPAMTAWHALFLGATCVSCMTVLPCGPCTPCKAICIATLQRGRSALFLAWCRCFRGAARLWHTACHILKCVSHCSSRHGWRALCSRPHELP